MEKRNCKKFMREARKDFFLVVLVLVCLSFVLASDLEGAKWIDKKNVFDEVDKEAYTLWPKEVIDYF